MILRMLPGPFFGALGTLMFLLLMQFLMRRLPDLVGKGLTAGVMVEIIAYNLAYMLVLAVPMSVLLAVISVFGRLAESGAYTVVKNAGISVVQLAWPVVVLAGFVTLGMTYFNNVILPESNFNAKALWHDIHRKKPGFALQPGVFYDGLDGYSIRAMDLNDTDPNLVGVGPDSGTLLDGVTVFDYTGGNGSRITLSAERGRLTSDAAGTTLDLQLEDGERHVLEMIPDRYERVEFDRSRLSLDVSDLLFERSGDDAVNRSDRTTRTSVMRRLIDSLDTDASARLATLREEMEGFQRIDTGASNLEPSTDDTLRLDQPAVLAGLTRTQQNDVYERAVRRARAIRAEADQVDASTRWNHRRADRYRVEVHKKYSIAFACLLFTLIGAPLGLRVGKGGLGVVAGLSIGLFLFYWVTLVNGEKLADREMLEPWIGMWGANLVVLASAALVGAGGALRAWWRRR